MTDKHERSLGLVFACSGHADVLEKTLGVAKNSGMARSLGDVGDTRVITPGKDATFWSVVFQQVSRPTNIACW